MIYQVKTNDYDGSGLVMAVVTGGEAVKLAYLREICPDYNVEQETHEDWLEYGKRNECFAKAQEFEKVAQTLCGHVIIGIASCYEVVEL